jgi:hypothetical protein
MSRDNGIQTNIIDGKLVISVPVDTIVYAYENSESNYKENGPISTIRDKEQFAKVFAEYVEEYGRNDESGLSALERLFDLIFIEMYCDALDCIVYQDEMNYRMNQR